MAFSFGSFDRVSNRALIYHTSACVFDICGGSFHFIFIENKNTCLDCNILKLVQKLVPGPDPILKYFQITLACSNIFKGVGLRRVSVCSFN